jgi:hypothetical protein
MGKITIKSITKYMKDEKYKIRHNVKAMKLAINELNLEVKTDSFDLLLLIIEDKPIDSLNTHSYGFHTANGRYLIDTFKSLYFKHNI